MEQKGDDDQTHDDHLDRQFVTQHVDGPLDQVGAVVRGHQVDPLGQRRLHLRQPLLDLLDDLQGVLAVPHDDDPTDDLAHAVELGQAAAHVGTQVDVGNVPEKNRRALRRGAQGHRLEVGDGPHVATPTDHVLGAGDLNYPTADIGVALAHGGDDPPHGARCTRAGDSGRCRSGIV